MKNIPIIFQHTGFSNADKEQLSVLFENAGRKLYDILAQKLGYTSAAAFKIYIDNQDPVPAVLQTKTVRATNASQDVVPDTGYDALSKVTIPAGIVLSSVTKSTDPSTTTYVAGQVFDKTGLSAIATYSNGATLALNAAALTAPTTPLTTEDTSVTISYVEAGVTKTFTVAVTVSARAVSSISVKTAPTKTAYTTGETLTMAGLVLLATYNDATTEDIAYGTEGITYSPAEGTAVAASGDVTITYASKTCTQAITFA